MDLNELSKEELLALLAQKENQINSLKEENKVLKKEKESIVQEKIIVENKLEDTIKEMGKAQEKIQILLKIIENKNIKLKKQLCTIFGIKSDKKEVVVGNEAEELATEKLVNKSESKSTKKRGRKPGTLDASKFDMSLVEYEEIVLNNEEEVCSACGTKLVKSGETYKYKVEIIPSKAKVVKYIINTMKCPNCSEEIDEKNINYFDNESFLTPSLAAYVVNNKYNYALPLYRQETMLKQLGAPLSRVQLANYCINVSDALQPIYDRLKERLLSTPVNILHADETHLRVLENKNKLKCYIWLYATSMYDLPIYIYEYQESREAKHPIKFLKNYNGYLVCDDYSGYESIDNVSLCKCWFHVKKRYAELIKTFTAKQKKNSEAAKIHNMISNIFYQDSLITNGNLNIDEIKKERLKKVKPLVDQYFEYIEAIEGVDKSSDFGKAINYSIKCKEELMRFLENGCIPLTNNLSERSIKPFVILRKNCLFSNTENGAEASAILMSIVQTAKMNLLKPDKYIEYVLENIGNTKQSDIDSLLPFSDTLPDELRYQKKDLNQQ